MTTSSNRYFAGNSDGRNLNVNFEGLIGSSSDKKKELISKSCNKSTQYNRRTRINNYSNANNGNNINSRLIRESLAEMDCNSYSDEHVKGQILSGFTRKKKMDRNTFVFDGCEVPQFRQNLRCLQNSPPPLESGAINSNNIGPIAGNFNNGTVGNFGICGGTGFYSRGSRLNNNDGYKLQKYNFNSSNVASGHFSENYQLTPIHFPVVNQLSQQVCNQILQGNICNYIPPPPDQHIPQESSLVKQGSFNCKINDSKCDDTVQCGNCGNNINYSNHNNIHLPINFNNDSSNHNHNNEFNCKAKFPFFQTPYSFRSYEISTLAAIDYLMPNMEFYDKINRVVLDLRNWMDNMNIPLFVFPYGSTSTGFADQFSDLDVALVPKQDVFESQNSKASEITIKLKSNNSPITDISNKPAGLILQELLNLLQKNTNKDSDSSSLSSNSSNIKFHDHPFTCIQDITSAHVPIIRMLHTKTDIVLDISIALCKLENLSNGNNINSNNYYYQSLLDQPYYYNNCLSPNIGYSNSMSQNDKKQIKNLIGTCDIVNNHINVNRRHFPTLRANSLPIIQSRLGILSWYAKLDPRVVHVVVLTKVWTRFRGLRNTLNGLPGGYAWTICVIYFFQRIGILPVIDPSEFIKKSQEFSTHITNEILGQISDNSNGDFLFSNIDGICEDGSTIEITNFPSLPIDVRNTKNKKNDKSNICCINNNIVNSNYNNYNNHNNSESPGINFNYGIGLNHDNSNSELRINNESSTVEIDDNKTFSIIENEKVQNNHVKLLYLDVVKGNGLHSNNINNNKNVSSNANETQSLSVSLNNSNDILYLSSSPEKSIGVRANNSKIEGDSVNNKNFNYNNIIDNKDRNVVCNCKNLNEDKNKKNNQISEKNCNSDLDSEESTPELSFMGIKHLSLDKSNNYDEEYDHDVFGESGRSSMGSTTFTYSPSPDNQSSDNLFIDSSSDSKFNNCPCSHTDKDVNSQLLSNNREEDSNNNNYYYCYIGNNITSNKLKTLNSQSKESVSSSQLQLSKSSKSRSIPRIGIDIGVGTGTLTGNNNNNNITKIGNKSKFNTPNKFNLDEAYNNTINTLFIDPPKLLNNVKTFDETSKYLKFSQSHILFYRFLLFLETHLWTTVIDISSPEIINTTSPGVCCNIRNPFPGPPACKPIFDQYHQEFLKSEIQRAIQIIQSPCGDFSSICGSYLDMPTDLRNNNVISGMNRKLLNNFYINLNNSIGNNNSTGDSNSNGVNCISNHHNNCSNLNNKNNTYRSNLNNGFINTNFNCNCSHCSKFIQINSRNNAQTNNSNNNIFNQYKNSNHINNKNKKNNHQNTKDSNFYHRNKDNSHHKIYMDVNSSVQYYDYNNVGLDVSYGSSYYTNTTNNSQYIGGAATVAAVEGVGLMDVGAIGGAAGTTTGMGMGLGLMGTGVVGVSGGVNGKILGDSSQLSTLYYDGGMVTSGVDSLRHYVFSPLANQLPQMHHVSPPLKDQINSKKIIITGINDNCSNIANSGSVINGCKKLANK
ncbi:hypothetical protein FG379_002095 [Cryptosporidium bovis]|uniref:uncharacterized protein n=1 Tax=Cryptosporidium bovis TaxID=310047 RepID=UPI00351A9635|nr:hypothetical protein FG379_002095 [Cryptosporidium bovis]